MNMNLPRMAAEFVEEQVRLGRYSTAEDVVLAALETLRAEEAFGDFAPGEMQSLLEQGERSGSESGWHSREAARRQLNEKIEELRNHQP